MYNMRNRQKYTVLANTHKISPGVLQPANESHLLKFDRDLFRGVDKISSKTATFVKHHMKVAKNVQADHGDEYA